MCKNLLDISNTYLINCQLRYVDTHIFHQLQLYAETVLAEVQRG